MAIDALGSGTHCSARYCSDACQRAAWRLKSSSSKSHARHAPRHAPHGTEAHEAHEVRCPACVLRRQLPRPSRLDSAEAQELLREGEAFVAPAEQLLGTRLLKWDFKYLEKHLPTSQRRPRTVLFMFIYVYFLMNFLIFVTN